MIFSLHLRWQNFPWYYSWLFYQIIRFLLQLLTNLTSVPGSLTIISFLYIFNLEKLLSTKATVIGSNKNLSKETAFWNEPIKLLLKIQQSFSLQMSIHLSLSYFYLKMFFKDFIFRKEIDCLYRRLILDTNLCIILVFTFIPIWQYAYSRYNFKLIIAESFVYRHCGWINTTAINEVMKANFMSVVHSSLES